MKRSTSPENASTVPLGRAALSSSRHDRGAHRDDAPAGRPAAVDGGGDIGRKLAGLRVHRVIGGVVHRDRQERAGTDVEGDKAPADAARVDRLQQAVGEVKARRRRSDGTLPPREHGLIVIAVVRIGRPPDIGWQRHGAMALERLGERRATPIEDEAHLRPVARLDGGREFVGKVDHVARPQPPRRLGECLPASVGSLPVQRELDPRLAPHAHQARRDHPRVVEDHQVSRPQQVRKVGHPAMDAAGGEIQEARGIARTGGARRDRLAREVEIEGVDPHRWPPAPPASGLRRPEPLGEAAGRSSARRSSRRRRRGRRSP